MVILQLLGTLIAAPAHAAALRPVQLRCEYAANPVGIDEPHPRLYWQLRGRGRGEKQLAYQVLVATRRELLAGQPDLWDSGRVFSDQSTHVLYRGKPLPSGQRCFWKVRVWDRADGEPSESEAAFWEMGLLRPEEWTAQWIGLPVPQEPNRFTLEGAHWFWYPEGQPRTSAPEGSRYFRRVVTVPAGRRIARAEFLGAVDNQFQLWVNGQAAGQGGGWFSASRSDVAARLQPGPNGLAVQATNASAGPAGLMGRLRVEFDSGDPLVMDLDSSWKVSDREAPGWQNAAFDDSTWQPAMRIGTHGDPPWGTVKTGGSPGPVPFLRKEFHLQKPVRRARAYVTALGAYQLHLNGKRVGDDLFGPGWTEYRKRVQYQTYDVTGLLESGANAVGTIVGDGWYAGSLGWDLSRNHFGPSPARVRLQLNVEYQDGSTERIVSDGSWTGAIGPIRESDIYGGEVYDARLELPNWDRPNYHPVRSDSPSPSIGGGGRGGEGRSHSPTLPLSPSSSEGRSPRSTLHAPWTPVTVYTDQNPELNARRDPPIRVTEELKPQAVTEPKPGVYVFDLGQNMVGMARLRVSGPAGTRVTLRFAEVLNPDGTAYRENLRMARATDVYVLKGGGTEVFEPHFTYHGFRYVEVTGLPARPGPEAITGRVFHSDMPFTARFTSSSELANRLFRNVLWGQRSNLMSVPTDCPQRDERLGWMGDAQIFARTANWYMDMGPFWNKWMRDIVDAQSPAGAFSDVSPRVVDLADGAPAWADAGIVVPWTTYECYGDTRILDRAYEPMRRYVDMLVAANPNLLWLNLRNNDFGDWVAAGSQTNKDLIASAYLAYDLRLLSRMAAALVKPADAEKYGKLADQARAAFNARFLAADGRYLGDTQTAYAMTLGMDLVPDERRAQVGERLAEAVMARYGRLSTGFIGTKFLLPALTDTGHNDLAFQVFSTTKYPSWGYMLEKGATTIWELWNSDTEGPGMNSRNHFAFGSVAEWMQRYLAGIDTDPANPGYRHVIIRPRPGGGFTHARGEYDSLHGTIVSAWRLETGSNRTRSLVMEVEIPANTTATVYIPRLGNTRVRVLEGGRRVFDNGAYTAGGPGIRSAVLNDDNVVLEIGSGRYRFHTD